MASSCAFLATFMQAMHVRPTSFVLLAIDGYRLGQVEYDWDKILALSGVVLGFLSAGWTCSRIGSMSWKLAELSWRQALGLYQNRRERAGGGARIEQDREFDKRVAGGSRANSENEDAQCLSPKRGDEVATRLGAPLLQKRPSLNNPVLSNSTSASLPEFDPGSSAVPLLLSFESICSASRSVDGGSRSRWLSTTQLPRSKSCPHLEPPSSCSLYFAVSHSRGSCSTKSSLRASFPCQDCFHDRLVAEDKFQLVPEGDASGDSTIQSTGRLLWLTPTNSLLFNHPLPQIPKVRQGSEVVDSPTFEYLRHFLGHEGAIFQILNPPYPPVVSVSTSKDSSQTQFAPTETKHWSGSLLLPRMAANGSSTENRTNRVTGRNALNSNNHGNGLGGRPNANFQTIEEMYIQYQFTMEDEGPPAPPSSLEEDITFDSQFASGLLALGAGARNSEGPNGIHNLSSQMQHGLARSGAQDGESLTQHGGEASNGVHTYPVLSQQAAGSPPDFPLPATPAHANRFASRDQNIPSVLPSSSSDRTSGVFETTSLPEATPETETSNSWESVETSRSTRTETYSGPALSEIVEDPTEDEFGEGSTDLSLNSSFAVQPLFTERNVGSGGQSLLQTISTVYTHLVADSNAEEHETDGTNLGDQDQGWETTEEEEEASGSQDQIVLNVQIPEVILPSLPSDPHTLSSSRNVVSTWDPLSAKDNLSTLPGALLTDKLNTGSFLETRCTKEKGPRFAIQFTDSLTNQELPTSQVWSGSNFQAKAPSTQRTTTSDKIATSTSAILLYNPVKIKDPRAKRTLMMPRSSAESTDGSYATSTEPFPDLNMTPSDAASVESARFVDAAARIYAPAPRRPREFPNARLTIDRRHRILTDPQLVAAQDIVGKQLLIVGTILYPFGGFLLINSMAEDGIYAHNAMMEVSKIMGLPVVGSVGKKHANMAKRIQYLMIWVGVAVMAAVVGVLAYAFAA